MTKSVIWFETSQTVIGDFSDIVLHHSSIICFDIVRYASLACANHINKPYFAVHFKKHVDCIAKTVPAVHPLVSLQMQMLYQPSAVKANESNEV